MSTLGMGILMATVPLIIILAVFVLNMMRTELGFWRD